MKRAVEKIESGGGEVVAGPNEIPGPALTVIALDPQKAAFAIVGPKT